MSRTPGLDDIPLDVFRGVVAFGMGRFTVGRLDGGMKVCGPEFVALSRPTAVETKSLFGSITIVAATTLTSCCCVWASRATRCLLNCR